MGTDTEFGRRRQSGQILAGWTRHQEREAPVWHYGAACLVGLRRSLAKLLRFCEPEEPCCALSLHRQDKVAALNQWCAGHRLPLCSECGCKLEPVP